MAYCTRCGKQINYDSVICIECVEAAKADAEQANQNTYHQYQPAVQIPSPTPMPPVLSVYAKEVEEDEDNSKAGFGMALTATILSSLAFIFTIIALASTTSFIAVSALLTMFVTLPAFVISLIFGLKSIGTYNKSKGNKPTATLILGIVSVSLAGLVSILVLFL